MAAAFGLALWSIGLVATPARAAGGITVTGAAADVNKFKALLAACAEDSPAFKDLLDRANASAKDVPFDVGHSQPGVAVDAFDADTAKPQTVDLDDVDKFPQPTRVNGKFTRGFPPGAPYGVTKCEVLAHSVGEKLHSVKTGDGYDKSHKQAIDEQNKVRADYGQTSKVTSIDGAVAADGTVTGTITFDDGKTGTIAIDGNANITVKY